MRPYMLSLFPIVSFLSTNRYAVNLFWTALLSNVSFFLDVIRLLQRPIFLKLDDMADLDIALGHLLHLLLQADLCIVHSYKSKMLCLHTFFDLFIHAQGISPLTAHKKADAVLISYVYRHQLFVAENI